MASLTRWTWIWENSGSWWWTGRPGVLRFMGSQRVGHDWATDLIWSDLKVVIGLWFRVFFLTAAQGILICNPGWEAIIFSNFYIFLIGILGLRGIVLKSFDACNTLLKVVGLGNSLEGIRRLKTTRNHKVIVTMQHTLLLQYDDDSQCPQKHPWSSFWCPGQLCQQLFTVLTVSSYIFTVKFLQLLQIYDLSLLPGSYSLIIAISFTILETQFHDLPCSTICLMEFHSSIHHWRCGSEKEANTVLVFLELIDLNPIITYTNVKLCL